MTDNELLLAIADIMDKKLDARLTPIETDIHDLKTDIQSMKADILDMKADILDLQNDVRFIKADIQSMKADILDLQNDVRFMKADILDMKADIQSMKTQIIDIQNDIQSIHLTQENIILPRLNTIESCYTTTYTRYKSYADKMEAAFVDIDLLKKVVSEHSGKLQKIS